VQAAGELLRGLPDLAERPLATGAVAGQLHQRAGTCVGAGNQIAGKFKG